MLWERGSQRVKEARTRVKEKEVEFSMASATIVEKRGTRLSSVQRKARARVKAKKG